MQYFSISLLFLYYHVLVPFLVQKSKKLPVLGIFGKLRKTTIGFVMPVCPSVRPVVRMDKLDFH